MLLRLRRARPYTRFASDLEPVPIGLVVDLQCRVPDPEAFVEEVFVVAADAVAVVARANEHVR